MNNKLRIHNNIMSVFAFIAVFFIAPVAFASTITIQNTSLEVVSHRQITAHARVYFDDEFYNPSHRPSVYFEYGTSYSLGSVSQAMPIMPGTSPVAVRLDVEPNTRYYVRAVVSYQNNRIVGNRVEVTTPNRNEISTSSAGITQSSSAGISDLNNTSSSVGSSSNTTTNTSSSSGTSNNTSGTSSNGSNTLLANPFSIFRSTAPSDISFISVTNNQDVTVPGESITYKVAVLNKTQSAIRDNVITITFPDTFEITAVSDRNARQLQSSNTIQINRASIASQQEIVFEVTGILATNASLKTLDVTANHTFTHPQNGRQVTVTATDSDRMSRGGTLSANASNSGFLPQSFFGWFIVIALLLAIVFIVRRYMIRSQLDEQPHQVHMYEPYQQKNL